jgi:nucleotide-binding universal stress UspA family protein
VDTIVVGYDASDEAGHALDRAVEYAKAFNAKLVVVAVGELPAYIPPYGVEPVAGMPATLEDPAVAMIDPEDVASRMLATARSRVGDVPADFVTRAGAADEGLMAVADETKAGLIVVGTRSAGFLGRLLEGSVSQDLTRRAHCDVLVVRPLQKD